MKSGNFTEQRTTEKQHMYFEAQRELWLTEHQTSETPKTFVNQTRPKKRLTLITSEINPKEFHFLNARLPEVSLIEVDPAFPSPLATFVYFSDHLGCIAAVIIGYCAVVFGSSTMMTPVARSCDATQLDIQKRKSGSPLAMECLFPRDAHNSFPRNLN